MRVLQVLVLVALALAFAAATVPRSERKKLQGPPSEFPNITLPHASMTAEERFSSKYDVHLEVGADGSYSYTRKVPVIAGKELTFSLIGPHADKLSVEITHPSLANGAPIGLMAAAASGELTVRKSRGPFGIDGNTLPSVSYVVAQSPAGDVIVTIRSPVAIADLAAVLLIGEETTLGLRSSINTHELLEEREIGINAHLLDASAPLAEDGTPVPYGAVESATLKITFPSGVTAELPMTDSGANTADAMADDNVYGATFEAVESGTVLMEATVVGVTPDGRRFERVTSHLAVIDVPYADITGEARIDYAEEADDILRMSIDIDSMGGKAVKSRLARLTARVYGTVVENNVDHLVPVAWVQSLEDIPVGESSAIVQLDLHHNWVAKTGAKAPFTLRDVVVQDANTNAVLSRREHVFVAHSDDFAARLARAVPYGADIEETEAMRMGPRPAKYSMPQATGNGKVLLVHGYCSGEVWPEADFTNAVVFKDLEQSRSQDEFAQLILKHGESIGPFSAIGHSQGGMALLHLKAYYWSGLDQVEGGRRVQSVGTPYRGCSMAGSLASIGNAFGVGCGSNYDLSVEGAALWEAAVPPEPRSEVYYYTTQYKPGFLSNCVTGSSLVLHTPNDGTSEEKYSTLSGATYVDHKEGWCHVSDMKYPPQCTDSARNAEMDAAAAR